MIEGSGGLPLFTRLSRIPPDHLRAKMAPAPARPHIGFMIGQAGGGWQSVTPQENPYLSNIILFVSV